MRHSKFLLHGAAWAALAAASRGQTTLYVSPTTGNDTNPGTVSQPLLTIGMALSTTTSGPLTIGLMPGDYSVTTNGDSFPMVVTKPDVTFAGVSTSGAPQRAGAKLVDLTLSVPHTMFDVDAAQFAPGTTIHMVFRDFAIDSTHRAIKYSAATANQGTIELFNLEIGCYRGVVVDVDNASTTQVTIDQCDIGAAEECIRVTSVDSGVTVATERSVFTSGGLYPVIGLHSDAGATIGLTQTNTTLRKGGFGIQAKAELGSSISTAIHSCNFHDLGFVSFPAGPGGGGIVNSLQNGTINHLVINSIFNGNSGQRDLPTFNALYDSIDTLMVEQTSLAGINGTFLGTPSWVSPTTGDYHLMPGSAAINAGNNAGATFATDMDGDPRLEPTSLGITVAIDVGADEFYERYVYVFPRRPKIGTTSAVRLFGPANSAYGWIFGAPDANGDVVDGTFGPALHLMNPIWSYTTGTVGANGFAQSSLTLPNSLGLVGAELGEQAVFSINPPTALWGWNGWQHVISR